jgi:hypothetical protein
MPHLAPGTNSGGKTCCVSLFELEWLGISSAGMIRCLTFLCCRQASSGKDSGNPAALLGVGKRWEPDLVKRNPYRIVVVKVSHDCQRD